MSVKTDFLSCKIITFSFIFFLPFMQRSAPLQKCFECLNAATTVKSHHDSKVLSLTSRAQRRCCRLVPEWEEGFDGLIYFLWGSGTERSRGSFLSHYAQNTIAGTHIQAGAGICIRTFIHSMKLYCTCPHTHILIQVLWRISTFVRHKQIEKQARAQPEKKPRNVLWSTVLGSQHTWLDIIQIQLV